MLGSALASTYGDALPVLLRDPGVDGVIALFVPPVVAGAEEVAAAIVRSVEETGIDEKPVLACVISADGTPAQLLSGAVAPFAYPESAARALGRAAGRAAWLRRPQGRVRNLTGIDRSAARRVVPIETERWLDPSETRDLLSAYGLPLVAERRVDSVFEAVAAANDFGYPVVLKTAEAGVHKTEQGGVALDLRDLDASCTGRDDGADGERALDGLAQR